MIPHLPIALAEIRVGDITFLLVAGAVYELVCRGFLLYLRLPGRQEEQKQAQLVRLNHLVKQKRKLGPSHFVETSKLERQLLALEKEVQQFITVRHGQFQKNEKILLRHGNMALSALVFLVYYHVPMITLDDLEGDAAWVPNLTTTTTATATTPAASYLRSLLFPLSVVGIGVRLSKFGLPARVAQSSLGAVVVLWSSQVFVGQLMDALEAYVLAGGAK